MEIDLQGRVKNTKLAHSNCLLPLFEAIVNSIDAVDEGGGGSIEIRIIRDTSQKVIDGTDGSAIWSPITGFEVEDSGIGFTQENFASFQTSDSTKKSGQGGKGVGRLMWLKAFDRAEVTSVYNKGKDFQERSFNFTLTKGGIEGHSEKPNVLGPRKTVIRLIGYKPGYREKCPKSTTTIARRIIEHCLEYFVLENCPVIRLHDPSTGDAPTSLQDFFKSEMCVESESVTMKVKGKTLHMHNVRISSSQDYQHRLHFCAHKRSVKSDNLASRLPNLQQTIKGSDDKPFLYAGYVSGHYLDDRVDSDRTSFDIADDSAGTILTNEPSWQEIVAAAITAAQTFLGRWITPVQVEKERQIRDYVETQAPQYRPLLKHKQTSLEQIPPNLPVDRLDVELHKIDLEYGLELREKGRSILVAQTAEPENQTSLEELFNKFVEEWNEAGQAKLAQYVAFRKATLALLDARLKVRAGGKYSLEDSVHKIIFPLKATSDDLRSDHMNLWIIDERLSYHYYLASDKPFKQIEAVEVDSLDRPDIIVFHRPFAFAEDERSPFRSVVLIEFKRPMRDDYDEAENPISQVYKYVRELKAGNAKDREGRPIKLHSATPFYAYIICDITSTLELFAENATLTRTPDGMGYVGFNQNLGVYVEIISFDKLVADAKKRNAILFDKLGIPNWTPGKPAGISPS